MDIYHTIIRPIVTEKTSHQATSSTKVHGGTYTFDVHPDASKAQIKDAVEKIYNVRVMDIRTMNRTGKYRRYRQFMGKTSKTKRAIITVDRNSHIDLF
ncbi:MAG: 50S ribosomal protein L23 [Phycisphaerae bacterium]